VSFSTEFGLVRLYFDLFSYCTERFKNSLYVLLNAASNMDPVETGIP